MPTCHVWGAVAVGLVTASLIAPAASAQEVSATPTGEILLRFRHFEGRNRAPGGVDDSVRQRARLGLRFAYGEELSALVQVQDVRVWGEESDTLGDFSASGLDFHQGFIEAEVVPDLRLRLGRQGINYLNQRLIGSANFVEQARSFDAVRLMGVTLEEQLVFDLFFAHLLETPATDPTAATFQAADNLGALALRLQVSDSFQPALLSVLDTNAATDRVRSTTGAVLQADFPFGLKVGVEGYYQTGGATREGVDVSFSAWMFATHLRFTLVDSAFAPFMEGFVEVLSGDDNPSDAKEKTFDTLFATNHKFYGEADFFLNIPNDTAKRGLLDAGALLGAKLGDKAVIQTAFHFFQAADPQDGPSSFGQELDVTLGWKPNSHISFDFNYSLFFPGDAKRAATDGDDLEHFVYATSSATF